MKPLITLALLVLPIIAFCQPKNELIEEVFPTKDGKIIYQGIIDLPGMSIDDVRKACKLYFITELYLDRFTINEQDLLVATSFFEMGHNTDVKNAKNWFQVIIEIKAGKLRYTLTNVRYAFDVKVGGYSKSQDRPIEKWLGYSKGRNSEKVNKELKLYAKRLESKFSTFIDGMKIGITQKEDW